MILGIHHVTALAGDPNNNLAFCSGALGLRLDQLGTALKLPGRLESARASIEAALPRLPELPRHA